MKKIKFIIIQLVLILVLFFWDIGSIFSDRKGSHPVQSNELNHTSGIIQNDMSSFGGTEKMERTISDFLKRYKIKGVNYFMNVDQENIFHTKMLLN